MDLRDLTVIENEKLEQKKAKNTVTNPIMKKFVQFSNEKPEKFSVKELFGVPTKKSNLP